MAVENRIPYPLRRLFSLRGSGVPALCALALCGLIACFEDGPVAGGGGVETTDGEIIAFTGMIQGVQVRLVPEAYNPIAKDTFPASLSAVTDAAGKYAFKNVPPGRYNLEAYQPKDGTRLWLSGFRVTEPGAGGTHTLPKVGLSRPGKLRLNWEGGHRGYVFIPGTTIIHRILTEEIEAPQIVIDSLPTGLLPAAEWSQVKTDTTGERITDSISIRPDSVTDWTVFAAWAHHGIWHVNTSATGAAVAGSVDSFPMLVRLTAPAFDFSQAAADGRDLRFSDPHGPELSYQVERWDTAAGLAEIWVKVPKVNGNSAADFFGMHWGNAGVDSHSSGPAVFGPAGHFAAVLHLGEAGNTTAGGYADATGSGRTGTGVALTPASTVAGVAGLCQNLNGTTQWINVAGRFPTGTAPRSLSAWGKLSNPVAQANLAVYGGPGNLVAFGNWITENVWSAWHWGAGNDLYSNRPADTQWHYASLDYDGAISRLYMDGAQVASGNRTLATTSGGFTIGASFIGDYQWPGMIDEVEMSTVSRSADWIKLSYETQKQGSKVLLLERLK